jgi:hypothetical protein
MRLAILGRTLASWRIRPTVLNQLYGLDAVSILVVAPTALVAGLACDARPGHRRPDRTTHITPATTNAGFRSGWPVDKVHVQATRRFASIRHLVPRAASPRVVARRPR